MNVPSGTQTDSNKNELTSNQTIASDELTIRIESEHEQPSAMSEEQKLNKRTNAPSLYNLLQKTLEDKGEYPLAKSEWSGESELKVEGLSDMTLHSFILKAESLGKKITYSKSLRIKISD